jgi:polyisoprenoid-binding protein YceI
MLKVLLVVVIVLVIIVAVLPPMLSDYIIGPYVPPLQLPLASAAPADGVPTLDGTWTVGSGSVAGFRAPESFLLQHGTLVGRTDAVTGTLVISENAIASGSFQVDLSKVVITIGAQTNDLLRLFDTKKYPDATFTLTAPVDLANMPTNGQAMLSNAAGSLTINNVTRPATFTLTGRYDGSALQATGRAPFLVSDFGVKSPFGIHNDAEIEFLVILQRG